MLTQQLVTVEVKIAHDRNANAQPRQTLDDDSHGRRRRVGVDRDAHELQPGLRERAYLLYGSSTSAVSVLVMDCTTTG